MLAGPGGEPPSGTIATALYSPATAAAFGRIHGYLRTESALGPRLFELLSLIAAREMNLAYEWSAHEGTALQAGLPPAVVEVVRMNEPITGLSSFDALVIDFGRQLFRTGTWTPVRSRRCCSGRAGRERSTSSWRSRTP